MKPSRIFLVTAALLLLLAVLYVDFVAGNISSEKEILLHNTTALLSGKRLYVDIFTVNPPMIYYLYALPVYISLHVVMLQDFEWLVLLGFIVVAAIIRLALSLIRFHPEFAHQKRKRWEFGLLLVSVFITFPHSMYFLDREHLFFLLTFPYVLRFMPSLGNAPIPQRLRIIIGLIAGIGLCIKPQCLILFVAIQALVFLRTRSLAILAATENKIIYAILALYVISIWLLTPEYITTVMPMALATYSASNRWFMGALYFASILLSFGMTFADFRWRESSPYRKDILYFLAILLAFLAYVCAGNGWGYIWNLVALAGLITTGFVLWEHQYFKQEYARKGLPVKSATFGIRACIMVFAYNAMFIPINMIPTFNTCSHTPYDCENLKRFTDDIESFNGGEKMASFGSVSTDFGVWSYLARVTGTPWQTRFNHLWMLPKFFTSDDAFAAKNKWILDYVGHAYAEDLKNNKPGLVFVDDKDVFYTAKKYVDIVAFLGSRSPDFAKEWSHYRYAGKTELPLPLIAKYNTPHHGVYIYKRLADDE